MSKKIVIGVYLDCGNVYEYEVETEEQAREHAYLITKNGYRSCCNGEQVVFYPPHRITKVKCTGDITTNYPDTLRGT